MNTYEIRNLTDEEIRSKIEEAYEELFNLRFQKAFSEIKDPSHMKRLRRSIARMKTILNERKLGLASE